MNQVVTLVRGCVTYITNATRITISVRERSRERWSRAALGVAQAVGVSVGTWCAPFWVGPPRRGGPDDPNRRTRTRLTGCGASSADFTLFQPYRGVMVNGSRVFGGSRHMANHFTIAEHAFALAKSGDLASVSELTSKLRQEGHDTFQFAGPSIRQQLRLLIEEGQSRKRGRATE
jgi:hypothetical protein